ncbi:MAG: type II/IV secretion system protein [Candidatus Pacebacteria bacterium]|nr:type II/IV secretion system protein [Candidatus Paceibacterota bacterium]
MIEFNEEKQGKRISDLRKKEEENLVQILSQKYGLTYLDLSVTSINRDALRILSEKKAREAQAVVFDITNKKINVAIRSPNSLRTREIIDELKQKGYAPTLFMVSSQSLESAWERYKDLTYSLETKAGSLDISGEEIARVVNTVKSVEDVKKMVHNILALKKGGQVSKILEIIIAGALATKASDIHLEPEEGYTRLRYRLDGVLIDITDFNNEIYRLVLSRIKLIASMKINIKNIAQDGRFTIKVEENNIEVRASAIPGAYNESIVLRILNPKSISVPLEELGIHPRLLAVLEYEIKKPNGMILTTGPTGSGKTTTLYAFLKKVHSSEIKIITIENPIEYHLPGIVQTQTDSKKGYTFLEGLRSALRQDPDVIMVGEIRDAETAEIAVNAALTGHLVFSTLHTNNAAGSFPRLIDLGVNPKVITSAIGVSMAQRLVRKLCGNCKKEMELTGAQKQTVEMILGSISDKSYLAGLNTKTVWEHEGCQECNFTGYKGRIGVYEAIRTDESIEDIVRNNPSEREIKKAAQGQNILSIRQDGIIKVLQGTTSLSELRRVVDLEYE